MSVVCNVVSKSATWIACDGRARNGERIVSEHVQKFRRINNDVIVGFTGLLETATTVLDHIERSLSSSELCSIKSNHYADFLSDTLKKSKIEMGKLTSFVVTGKTSLDIFASFAVMQSGKIVSYIPDEKNILHCISIGDLPGEETLSDFVECSIAAKGLSRDAIISGMQDYIFYVADRTPSVNKNVLIAEIHKQCILSPL